MKIYIVIGTETYSGGNTCLEDTLGCVIFGTFNYHEDAKTMMDKQAEIKTLEWELKPDDCSLDEYQASGSNGEDAFLIEITVLEV